MPRHHINAGEFIAWANNASGSTAGPPLGISLDGATAAEFAAAAESLGAVTAEAVSGAGEVILDDGAAPPSKRAEAVFGAWEAILGAGISPPFKPAGTVSGASDAMVGAENLPPLEPD